MGLPVKIRELAERMIQLYAPREGRKVDIVYTGLRPGEKLYEEKLMAEEGLQKTQNDLIHIGNPIPFDIAAFLADLKTLLQVAYENDEAVVQLVAKMVPTYKLPANSRK